MYTLPGGENYREILIYYPENKFEDPNNVNLRILDVDGGERLAMETTPDAAREWQQSTLPAGWSVVAEPIYKSESYDAPHFRQGDRNKNLMTHIRLTDRPVNGKRAVMIEEGQSDLHQAGREHGYRGHQELPPNARVRQATETDETRPQGSTRDLFNRGTWVVEQSKRNEWGEFTDVLEVLGSSAHSPEAAIRAARSGAETGLTPPLAPYKGNAWQDLVFRRALIDAAEKDVEELAWTTGEQQSKRYNKLFSDVTSVTWDPVQKELKVGRKNQAELVIASGDDVIIPNVIGKDAAKRLRESEIPEYWYAQVDNRDTIDARAKFGDEYNQLDQKKFSTQQAAEAYAKSHGYTLNPKYLYTNTENVIIERIESPLHVWRLQRPGHNDFFWDTKPDLNLKPSERIDELDASFAVFDPESSTQYFKTREDAQQFVDEVKRPYAKILHNPARFEADFSKDPLTVSSAGMRQQYDENWVGYANKLGKPYGVTARKVPLEDTKRVGAVSFEHVTGDAAARPGEDVFNVEMVVWENGKAEKQTLFELDNEADAEAYVEQYTKEIRDTGWFAADAEGGPGFVPTMPEVTTVLGVTDFVRGPTFRSYDEAMAWAKDHPRVLPGQPMRSVQRGDKWAVVLDSSGNMSVDYATKAEADAHAVYMNSLAPKQQEGEQVWSLPITPQMKKDILDKGLPLMSEIVGAGAALTLAKRSPELAGAATGGAAGAQIGADSDSEHPVRGAVIGSILGAATGLSGAALAKNPNLARRLAREEVGAVGLKLSDPTRYDANGYPRAWHSSGWSTESKGLRAKTPEYG